MIGSDIVLIALAVALALIALAAAYVFGRWWMEATVSRRYALVREAARWTVEAAELLHAQPGSGKTKLTWVLERLQQRFPEFDEAALERQVEKAVRAMNDSKTASPAVHLNGAGPRYVERN